MSKSFFIDTMGCQMNERDSETIAGELVSSGFSPCSSVDTADIIVLNTCAVREKPEQKVFSHLSELARLKQQRPDMLIIVAGCIAQVLEEQIFQRAPYVDIVIGPRNLSKLVKLIKQNNHQPVVFTDDAEIVPEGLQYHRAPGISAFVNISYGCDNFCSYCIVPYARGRQQSREVEAIIAEVEAAIASGYREITLLGQNVNSFSSAGVDFPELLKLTSQIEGLKRLRFTTSHPKDLSPGLIEVMATQNTVCEHLHLPIQAADDTVLAHMGRGYNFAQYKSKLDAARAAVADITITTDVMVGFPGETEAQFMNTYDAFAEIRYDQAFMFKYSDRPGTRASERNDKIPAEVKQHRLLRLVELQNDISRDINRNQAGKVFEILVEGRDHKFPEKWRGRTRGNKIVVTTGPQETDLTGQLIHVQTHEGFLWGFTGEIVPD